MWPLITASYADRHNTPSLNGFKDRPLDCEHPPGLDGGNPCRPSSFSRRDGPEQLLNRSSTCPIKRMTHRGTFWRPFRGFVKTVMLRPFRFTIKTLAERKAAQFPASQGQAYKRRVPATSSLPVVAGRDGPRGKCHGGACLSRGASHRRCRLRAPARPQRHRRQEYRQQRESDIHASWHSQGGPPVVSHKEFRLNVS